MVGRIKKGITGYNEKSYTPELLLLEKDMIQVSVKNKEEEYIAACDDTGFWYCGCPDFEYRHERESGSFICKHIVISILFLNDYRKKGQVKLDGNLVDSTKIGFESAEEYIKK